ncbi:MAG: sensor domain-containing protein [Acidimicrobiia bacterium]
MRSRELPRGREHAAAAMLEQLAAIVESSDDAIIGKALDGTILSWNAAAQRMYGYAATEVLGRRVSVIVPAEYARELESILVAVGRGERVEHLETVRRHKDGSRVDVSVTVSPIRDATGQVIGASAIARDIRERKRAEAQLRAKDEALEQTCGLLERAEALSRTGSWILTLGDPPGLFWSKEAYRLLGIAESTELTFELFFSHVHPDDRELVSGTMAAAVTAHRAYEVEHRMIAVDGTTRWVQVWAEPEYADDGTPVRVVGVAQDITERYEADEAMRASEQRFRLLAENARDLIFRYVVAPTRYFEYVSPASLAVTGFTPDELYADPTLIDRLIGPDQTEAIEHLVDTERLAEAVDVAVRRKDGSTAWVSQQLSPVYDADGVVVALEGISRDITRRKEAEDQLQHQGLHDALTGLPNRVLLRDRIMFASAQAGHDHSSVIVVAFDLDDFKLVNDTHGSTTGDHVLRELADRLTHAMTPDETVARTGSDEFVVVGRVGNEEEALDFVDRVREVCAAPIGVDGVELFVRGSLGVAIAAPPVTADDVLRDADLALSRAKLPGSNGRVEYFDAAMRGRTSERFALIGDLHRAMERNEFALHYQPIVRLTTGRIVGAEALIRWHHPDRGLVVPTDFIGIAEDTGQIIEIGGWVLREACRQLTAWTTIDAALGDLALSVNVSQQQLRVPGVADAIADTVARSGVDPTRITLELTESVLADDLDSLRLLLGGLRELGLRVAVDDFGTGYSSLAYLKHLPLDTLKIDQAFIKDLGVDPYDGAIVASALSVARAVGLFVVAEGVETREQLAGLRALNCDAVQGFFVSRPLPADEFRDLASSGSTW